MANKKRNKAPKAKTRVITKTKTRKVYVQAKRAGRRVVRAAGEKMRPLDVALAVGGAGVGSIGGSLLISKMPDALPDMAKNGIVAALGGFVAYKGLRKRNRLFLGLGLGASAAAATNIIGGLISGSTVNGCAGLSAPYAQLSAPYSRVGAIRETVGVPLAGYSDDEEE